MSRVPRVSTQRRPGCPRCDSLTRMVGNVCATCFDELVKWSDENLDAVTAIDEELQREDQ